MCAPAKVWPCFKVARMSKSTTTTTTGLFVFPRRSRRACSWPRPQVQPDARQVAPDRRAGSPEGLEGPEGLKGGQRAKLTSRDQQDGPLSPSATLTGRRCSSLPPSIVYLLSVGPSKPLALCRLIEHLNTTSASRAGLAINTHNVLPVAAISRSPIK